MINWIDSIVAPYFIQQKYNKVCEIGSSTGAATDRLLELTGATVTIVDPCMDVDLIAKYESTDRVEIAKGLSLDVLPSLQKVYDCIMIDGDHNWYTVYHELKSIHQHGILRPGGTIFFHDVGWPYGRRDMYYSLESIPQQYINPHNREGIVRGYSKTVANLTWPHDVAASEGGPKNGVLTAIEDFYHENKQDYGFCSCTSVEAGLGVLYKKGPIANDSAFRQLRFKLLGMSFKSLNAATAMQKLKTIISR